MVESKWGCVVTYANGDQVMLLTTDENMAEECVRLWRSAVVDGHRFVEFPLASGYTNAHLTKEIVRACVVNLDELDEQAVESLKRRKRIEAESDYSGG